MPESTPYIPEKRIYNCVSSSTMPSDYQLQAVRGFLSLPFSVDLSSKCSPVVNQGPLGSCTANAIASGLREFMMLKAGQPLTRLSRLFLYYEERKDEGTVTEDSGAQIKDGMAILHDHGVCQESDWPYDVTKFKLPPPPNAYTDATKFKVNSYFAVRNNMNEVKSCLAQGYPVVIGMEVFKQFESPEAASTGIIRVPARNESPLGGHAVLLTGYQDNPTWKGGGYFIVRNSWGSDWGLKGYFKVSFQYMKSGYIFDFWTAR